MSPLDAPRLDLGPDHPSRPGLTLIRLTQSCGEVQSVHFQPGFLHRGAEKLFEARDYRSVLMLADRHDWQASFSGELCIASTCERAMGLQPPPRAERLRVLLAELARAHSHAAALSFVPHLLDEHSLSDRVRRLRESIREAWGELTGNRVHPMINRLGGLFVDPSSSWLAGVADQTKTLADSLGDLAAAQIPRGLGTLTAEDIAAYGLSGPVSAASGLLIDERLLGQSAQYAGLPRPTLPTETAGDARARFIALACDLYHSGVLMEQLLSDLPEGPIGVKLSKIIKVPESTTYATTAAPWGTAGCFLVSRGDRTPWRLGLRTPTFANCSALDRALVGAPMGQLATVVASLGYGIGDLDR